MSIGALCGTVPFAFTAFDCSIDSDVFHTWATNTAAGAACVQRDRDDGQRLLPQTARHAGCVAG